MSACEEASLRKQMNIYEQMPLLDILRAEQTEKSAEFAYVKC